MIIQTTQPFPMSLCLDYSHQRQGRQEEAYRNMTAAPRKIWQRTRWLDSVAQQMLFSSGKYGDCWESIQHVYQHYTNTVRYLLTTAGNKTEVCIQILLVTSDTEQTNKTNKPRKTPTYKHANTLTSVCVTSNLQSVKGGTLGSEKLTHSQEIPPQRHNEQYSQGCDAHQTNQTKKVLNLVPTLELQVFQWCVTLLLSCRLTFYLTQKVCNILKWIESTPQKHIKLAPRHLLASIPVIKNDINRSDNNWFPLHPWLAILSSAISPWFAAFKPTAGEAKTANLTTEFNLDIHLWPDMDALYYIDLYSWLKTHVHM